MSKRVEIIDSLAEQRPLSMDEWEERINLEKNLEEMDRLEDMQWKQKAGKNWVLQGDGNTHFFQQFMNGRRRKKQISFLDSDNGEIRGQKNITNHIVEYYKQLFGHNSPCSMFLGENFWPSDLNLEETDKAQLIRPFSLDEIKEVVMILKENSALGPNGFSVSFFKKFWELVKGDMLKMFQDLWNHQLDIKRLNFGVITWCQKLERLIPLNILGPFVFSMLITNVLQKFLLTGLFQWLGKL